MARLMYDSVNMDAIPLSAEIVAGYPHAFPVDYSRFPKALQVRIDQHGNHPDDCHVADIENGAISIDMARIWVVQWHNMHPNGLAAVNGFFDLPTVYVNEANLASLRNRLVGLTYDTWVAWWNIGPTEVPGTELHQYESPLSSPPSAGDYDVSVVYDNTWGVRPVPGEPAWKIKALSELADVIALIRNAP